VFNKFVIISELDEELKLPKDKFCTTGLVKILRQGAVKNTLSSTFIKATLTSK